MKIRNVTLGVALSALLAVGGAPLGALTAQAQPAAPAPAAPAAGSESPAKPKIDVEGLDPEQVKNDLDAAWNRYLNKNAEYLAARSVWLSAEEARKNLELEYRALEEASRRLNEQAQAANKATNELVAELDKSVAALEAANGDAATAISEEYKAKLKTMREAVDAMGEASESYFELTRNGFDTTKLEEARKGLANAKKQLEGFRTELAQARAQAAKLTDEHSKADTELKAAIARVDDLAGRANKAVDAVKADEQEVYEADAAVKEAEREVAAQPGGGADLATAKREAGFNLIDQLTKDDKNTYAYYDVDRKAYVKGVDAKSAILSPLSLKKLAPEFDRNSPNNPAAIDNLRVAAAMIQECNRLRAQHNLQPLKVTLPMLVASWAQTSWARQTIDHSRVMRVAENLAWGYAMDGAAPFAGWYTKERALYLSKEKELGAEGFKKWLDVPENYGKVGHYINIIDPRFTVSGAAAMKVPGSQYGSAFGQTFAFAPIVVASKDGRYDFTAGSNPYTYTADEWARKVEDFAKAIEAAGASPAQKKLAEAKKRLDAAQKKLAQDTALRDKLNKELADQQAKVGPMSERTEKLREQLEKASTEVPKFERAVQMGEEVLRHNEQLAAAEEARLKEHEERVAAARRAVDESAKAARKATDEFGKAYPQMAKVADFVMDGMVKAVDLYHNSNVLRGQADAKLDEFNAVQVRYEGLVRKADDARAEMDRTEASKNAAHKTWEELDERARALAEAGKLSAVYAVNQNLPLVAFVGAELTDDVAKHLSGMRESMSLSFDRSRKFDRTGAATLDVTITQGETSRVLNMQVNVVERTRKAEPGVPVTFVDGFPDGRIMPEASVTRAQAAAMLARIMPAEVRDYRAADPRAYADVAAGSWYAKDVKLLSDLGIIQGEKGRDGRNFFRPEAPITRAEFAAMAVRLAAVGTERVDSFKDTTGHWADDLIRRAAALGWVTGYPNGTFRPQGKISRAETVTVIDRVVGNRFKDLPLPAKSAWTDAKVDAWYYRALMVAAMNPQRG